MAAPCPYTVVLPDTPAVRYRLTVVTVCFNALKLLPDTVASVEAQKAKGEVTIEHIIVDGASTDGTAEWLAEAQAAGRIERFVSEPDRGIYDAMNKGINMAEGEVIVFINAGDALTGESLQPCITPITEGRTEHVAARARLIAEGTGIRKGVSRYNPCALYIVTPCCHQAYFARTSLYRRCGGYAAQEFRCCADGDAMARHSLLAGEPLPVETEIADFAVGGFSHDPAERFLDEWLCFTQKYRTHALERAAANPDTAAFLNGFLLHYAMLLTDWQRRHRPLPAESLEHYAAICRAAAALPSCPPEERELLQDVADTYVPRLLNRPALPLCQRVSVYSRVRFCHFRRRAPQSGALRLWGQVAVLEMRIRLGAVARRLFGYHR